MSEALRNRDAIEAQVDPMEELPRYRIRIDSPNQFTHDGVTYPVMRPTTGFRLEILEVDHEAGVESWAPYGPWRLTALEALEDLQDAKMRDEYEEYLTTPEGQEELRQQYLNERRCGA